MDKTNCKSDKKICCSVENCIYHCGETTCTAKTIDVGPHVASCSQDTSCATFRPESK